MRYFRFLDGSYVDMADGIVDTDGHVYITAPTEYDPAIHVPTLKNGKAVLEMVSLPEYKKAKRKAINKRTGELIGQGFEYPAASGQIFSLSDVGQNNLHGLKANIASTPYPFPWTTIDDEIEYLIADQADAEAFYGAAFTVVVTHRQGGNALKKAVNQATDKAGVDAVTDNR